MGYFSLGMAKLVGPGGRVLSLDIQEKMLNVLEKRARKAGLWDRIETRLIDPDGFGLAEKASFANCFWMVHEVPDQLKLFSDLADALDPGAHVLVAEPRMANHVSEADLENTISLSYGAGFSLAGRPAIRFSSSALLCLDASS
jgi:SAM-dependent methyltransferase